jgi:hypothetical protein
LQAILPRESRASSLAYGRLHRYAKPVSIRFVPFRHDFFDQAAASDRSDIVAQVRPQARLRR